MYLLDLPEEILDRIFDMLRINDSVAFHIYRFDMQKYGEIREYDAWFLEEDSCSEPDWEQFSDHGWSPQEELGDDSFSWWTS
jgi:hypothetical protein